MMSLLSFRGAALAFSRCVSASIVGAQRGISTLGSKRVSEETLTNTSHTQNWEESEDAQETPNIAWITKLNNSPMPERVGVMSLPPRVFSQPLRRDLLHRVVVFQRAGWRQGTVKVKNRGEVRGSGRKIRPQKGTGKSRASSIRAPLFRKGGVVHGPTPRDFSIDLPKKVVNLGIRVALSVKYAQGDLHIVDSFDVESHKTKYMQSVFEARGWKSALVLTPSDMPVNFSLAVNNLPGVDVKPQEAVNVYDLLLRESLILTPEVVDFLSTHLSRFASVEEEEEACEIFLAELEEEGKRLQDEQVDLKDIPDITTKN